MDLPYTVHSFEFA